MSLFRSKVAALVGGRPAAGAGDGARPDRERHHRRHRQGLVGRRHSRRDGQGRQRSHQCQRRCDDRRDRVVPLRDAGRPARTAWKRRWTGSKPPCAGSCSKPGQTAAIDVTLSPARFTQSVVVTARRVEEVAQEVPIPVSVVRGDLVADAGAFNVNRLKELIPTVQFYSTNPRNSAINIRGLGAPFGLTNDGIEPGVGLYIDGVFYARPAVGDARLPRRRAGRSAARTAGHALRQEHDRRRHQRHDPQAQLHAGHRVRAQLRQPRIRSGEGLDHRPARRRRSPGGCRSPAPSATARSTTPRRRTT